MNSHGFSFDLVYCIQLCFVQAKPALISATPKVIYKEYPHHQNYQFKPNLHKK